MNEFIEQFHFLRPWWFLALIPALLCALALWHNQRQDQQLKRVFNPAFLPFLLDKTQVARKKWPLVGLFSLWLIATAALAGPAWQKVPQPVERNTDALVICWDLSPSMLAGDLSPSRLMRSRLKLIDLLQSRSDGQVALVAYAGEAHTVTPLTEDYETIINLLPALSPTTLPSTGSNAEMALEQAIELLQDAGARRGNIVFLTDGIAPAAFDTLARLQRDTPHQLSIWGIGTTEGAPIPLPNGGFAKDAVGETVIAKLNEDELQQFSSRTGAHYVPVLPNDGDIATLEQLLKPSSAQTSRSERTFDQWFEHGQFLALLLLPFAAWFFRRGWIFSLCFILGYGGFLAPQQAQALQWQNLWLNQDQQAQHRFEQGEPDAARQFSSPARRGAALFENQAFAEAATEFAQGNSAEHAYNRGTALTHAGEYQAAIEAFDQALEHAPSFEQAQHNRAIAEQLAQLEQQQQEQNQQNDQGEQSGEQQDPSAEQQQTGDQQQTDEQGQTGDAEQPQDGEQSQQQDADSEQQEQMSDADAQEAQDTDEQEQQNPYADAQREQEPQTPAEQSAAQADADEQAAEQTEEQVGMAIPEGQSEEEQKLEQWLRKVPDDPSGLMRNKFKYQYMQRQRQLDTPAPYSDNQAQQRW